ncbi:MAG: hypothetical protein C0401_09910 [Anaerolinea sp.]|nr:hypothetical protein [Anaerolinea sp.]
MNIMEALASKNIKLLNCNRWLVLNAGIYTVFEHRFRKATDVKIYEGENEEDAVRFLIDGESASASKEQE